MRIKLDSANSQDTRVFNDNNEDITKSLQIKKITIVIEAQKNTKVEMECYLDSVDISSCEPINIINVSDKNIQTIPCSCTEHYFHKCNQCYHIWTGLEKDKYCPHCDGKNIDYTCQGE